MGVKTLRKSGGFTLIEMAIVLGVLGAVLLVAAQMLTGTVETYTRVTQETETVKNARYSLEEISRDARESVNFDIQNAGLAPPDPVTGLPAVVTDGLLLTSSRLSNGTFDVNLDNTARPGSIVLYYLNTTAEGIPQLIRHQLFFAEDLFLFTPPFQLLAAPGPYIGINIVIVDNFGNMIPINRTTGGSGAVMPLRAPKVMMNGATSLDLVGLAPTPIEVRITCQFTDRNGRSTTTRLSTTVKLRNM